MGINSVFDLLWGAFSLSLLIVTLIFLTNYVYGNEVLIPNFNNTMFQFVFIGHWIMIGVAGLALLVLFGFFLSSILKSNYRKSTKVKKVKKVRVVRAAPYKLIEL